jgi:hypothetical protein
VLKPGTTAFVYWHNYDRNTDTGNACHEDYWVGVICSEMIMQPRSARTVHPVGSSPLNRGKRSPKP